MAYSQGSPNRYPNQSFIAVFTTEAELTDSKANKGAMAFVAGSVNRFYIYTGSAWLKSADDYVAI